MKCLSTPKPPKHFFALISIALVSLVLLMTIASAFQGQLIPWGQTVFAIAIVVLIPLILHLSNARALKDVADSVWDCGESLLVRHNGTETYYPLSRCVDVHWFREKPRGRCISITVEKEEGKLAEFVFLHGIRSDEFPRFWREPKLVAELNERIADARRSETQ